jgi:GNAT superfamily N-acetyltransferase
MALALRIEPAASATARALVDALDDDLHARYPDMPTNGIDHEGFEAAGGVLVVAYLDGDAAGCGAFRPLGTSAEVKRMYVAPAFRGRGVARAILAFVEAEATRRGYTHGMLETGTNQPEAVALYRACGWTPIAAYAPFNDATSFCFKKALAPE